MPTPLRRNSTARSSRSGSLARLGSCGGLVLAGLAALPIAAPSADAAPRAQVAPVITRTWSVPISDSGTPIAMSSPDVAVLGSSGPSVVVGDRAGRLYALRLDTGATVPGWPVSTGAAVDSTPSVSGETVYVGVGDSGAPTTGDYAAYNPDGTAKWSVRLPELPGSSSGTSAVQASLAVGTLQGQTSVVAGSLGQQEDAIAASSGAVLPGFPWFQADSNFTTPALADLYGTGQNEIVEGGDSTAGVAEGVQYTSGGHIRVLSQTGALGQPQGNGGLSCQYNTDQVVQSSPAVGRFLAGSGVGIVAGTGMFYSGARTTNQLLAVDTHCNLVWAATLDGATNDSPALVDALGNGSLQVAEGTNVNESSGTVYLLNGSNGRPIWSVPAAGAVVGSIVSADLGAGYQDLIVPTTGGVQILDGTTGAQLATLDVGAVAFQNSPLVTADANGTVGITVAGYNAGGSQIDHFEVAATNGALVDEAGAWPMFHHDPQLTGDAGTPPPVVNVPCSPPATTPAGYYQVASDGGVFSFGNLPFCGSTGNLLLQRPVVGMAATPTGGGYWLVASDGGIFAFGDAPFAGSTGNLTLNSPIVGMAATASGRGYWLVAADGGIFTFGDAAFHGSTGNLHLNSPIVGMAATSDGGGYWLVAADGGIFTFGDAAFAGSTGNLHLNQPVVAMATDATTGGYWLVAADGGVFSFNAPFLGSTGNLHLNRPIVAAQATGRGSGYRFVASDGGVFDFGSAAFDGSEGGKPLNRPIVGTAGF